MSRLIHSMAHRIFTRLHFRVYNPIGVGMTALCQIMQTRPMRGRHVDSLTGGLRNQDFHRQQTQPEDFSGGVLLDGD